MRVISKVPQRRLLLWYYWYSELVFSLCERVCVCANTRYSISHARALNWLR